MKWNGIKKTSFLTTHYLNTFFMFGEFSELINMEVLKLYVIFPACFVAKT